MNEEHDHEQLIEDFGYCDVCYVEPEPKEVLQGTIEGDSVMQTTASEERLILKTMNALPSMANERGKEYAKRISSKVDIQGNITFGIILPEGGRADVGSVNPFIVQGFPLINALSELLDVCDQAWEIMAPSAPKSTNNNPAEAITPADIAAYQLKVAAQADLQLRDEAKETRDLFNTAPKIRFTPDKEEYVSYNGFAVYMQPNVEYLLPEPWYNILMESRNADKKRAAKSAKMKNLESGELDALLSRSKNQAED